MIANGDRVIAGFTKYKVYRLERRRGIDGAVLSPIDPQYCSGSAPHWVPLYLIRKDEGQRL